MAIKFRDTSGTAKKSNIKWYQFKEGLNRFRMVGDILPMYVYWKVNNNNKNLPVECLSFNREEERFDNIEKDWFSYYFPEAKCQWSYVVKAFDEEGNLVTVQLKKRMFKQIQDAAEDLGDPTDPDKGWEIVVKREKTGAANWNVEYSLQILKCSTMPLTKEQKELIKESPTIDEELPRPKPDEQKKFIEKNYLSSGHTEEESEEVPPDIKEDFEGMADQTAIDHESDDIPF